MKKALCILIAVLMFGVVAAPLSAQTVWDGTADISWYDADQTSFDITTPEQLAGVAQLVNSGATSFNGKTLNLQNDLWLNSTGDSTHNWVPIGGSATATSESSGSGNSFKGAFNGRGHTIYNLYCEKTNYFHAGLFGCVQNPCTIDSLVMYHPTLKSCGMMGAIVGMSRSGGQIYIRYCLVIDAHIVGTPSGTGPSAEHNNIGGILGANYPNSSGTYIENCGVTGSISGRYIGGIGGNAEYAYLTNCYFAGDLTPLNSNYGGITSHGGNRTNCYSYTNILNSQSQSSASHHGTSVTQTEMQSDSMITLLGSAFKRDNGINSGYPVMSYMAGVDPVAVEICLGDWVTLTAFGYDSYLWDNGATTESIDVSPTTTTTYSVTGTLNGVSATHTSTVTVLPQAVIAASVMPANDGQVHGTVSPETTTVTCGSSNAVTLTVTPDDGWRVLSVYVNGSQTYGESTYGTFPFTVTPDGPTTHVDIHLTDALTCTHVHNLTASDIYATNATVAWTAHTTGELSEYHILVHNLTSGAVAEYTTTDYSYMLTELSESSSYQVGVYTFCTDGYGSDTVTVNFTTPCIAPITVANNSYPSSTYTTEGNHFPMSNHYLNSFTEQIYLPSDFNYTSADFSGMSFQYNDGQVITRTLDIYMAHTADVEFVQNVWATPLDSYVHVYSGPVTFNNTGADRWVDIAFDTNFYYNGYDNLLLIVNDVTGSSVSNSNAKFYTLNTNVNRSQCEYNNDASANWSITNLPATGRLKTQVDNIRLTACDAVSCIAPNTLVLGVVDANTAEVSWYNPNASQSCEIEYKADADADWTSTGSFNGSSYTLYNLDANTHYQLRVRALCGNSGQSPWSETLTFRTECGPIVNLPYLQTFDTDTYGSGTEAYIYCWDRYTTDASKPVQLYPTNAAHTTPNALRFYDGANVTNIAIMPKVDESISVNQLHITFWVRSTSSSAPAIFELGVMTDKDDPTTFEVMDTVPTPYLPDNQYTFVEYSLAGYTGNGQYIAFRVSNGNGGNNIRLDDVTLDYATSCSAVSHLEVSDITGTSAMLTWSPGFFGTVDSYTLEYAEGGTGNWTTVDNITTTSYLLGGLDFSTYYDIRVKPNCNDLTSGGWVTETFRTNCLVGGDVAIGEGTATNTYLPSYSFYNYSYTQQLFLAEEMGQPKTLESVTFDLATYAVNRTYKIYLMHTSATSVSSWVDASSAQLVFDASQQLHAGLNTFQFSTPFQYNGSDNLLLIVMDMTGSYQSSPYNAWRSHSAFSNASRYVYQDGSAYSTSSVPSSSGTGTSSRNNVIFGSPCDTTTTCVPPHPTISAINSSSATVNWVPGYQESAWELEYRQLYDTNWVSVGSVTSMSEVLTGLTANTPYKVRMRSDCGDGEYSPWTEIQFTTSCAAWTVTESSPWFDDFETYSSTTLVCWESPVTYTSSSGSVYPKVLLNYGEAAHSGGNTAEFKGVSNMLVLPEFTNDIHTLRMSFWATKFGATTTAVVGVVTDWTDPSTFEVLGDAGTPGARGSSSGGNGNYMGPFDFNGVQAASGRIAILFSGTTGDAGWNMDDFTVEIIPNCPSPVKTSVTVTGITNNTAEVSWVDNDASHNSWTVFYKPASDFSNNWQTVVANQPSLTLTGLSSITQYQVYVITNCAVGDNVPDATQTVTFTTLPSCPAPSGLVASGILATTADLYWVVGSDETEWEIEYGVENFTLGMGTTVTATGGTSYYQLQNLMPNTKYDAYVRAACSTQDHSEWSAKVNFRTACDAFPLPMTENFDSYSDWAAPDCWKKFESPNITGYAYVYGTDHYSGSKSLKVGAYASGDYFGYIRLPLMDAPSLTGLQISFMAKRSSGFSRPLQVCVSQELGSIDNMTVVASIDTLSSTWKEVVVPFSSYTGTGMYIVLGVPATYNDACEYWVDDVVVDYADSSAIPVPPTVETTAATNITTTTATLNGIVSNPDNVTLLSKGFEWKAAASDNYTPVVVSGATLTHNLTGLTPNTDYTFRAFLTTTAGTQYGSELTFTTDEELFCDVPTGLDTTLVANEIINLTWDNHSGVNSWNLRYRPENGEWVSASAANNGYPLTGLTSNTTYEIQVQAVCANGLLSDWSASLFVTTKGVGLADWLANRVMLFPNPAQEVVNVQCTMDNGELGRELYLFDVYGKLLQIVPVSSEITRINVSGLADGMYFVRVSTEAGTVTKAFVKR